MAVLDVFDVELEPAPLTEAEQIREDFFINSLKNFTSETGDFREALINAMGYTRAPVGGFEGFKTTFGEDVEGTTASRFGQTGVLSSTEARELFERGGSLVGAKIETSGISDDEMQSLVGVGGVVDTTTGVITIPGTFGGIQDPTITATGEGVSALGVPPLSPEEAEKQNITNQFMQELRGRTDTPSIPGRPQGELRRLSDDEYLSTLGATDQQVFRNFTAQVERQRLALEGKLPVSEGLKQQKADQYRQLQESSARSGNILEGDDPGTATSRTTAGTQTLLAFNKRFDAIEDAERRGEIQTGVANQAISRGLFSNLQQKDISNIAGFPASGFAPSPFAGQTGILSKRSIYNANARAGGLEAIAGLGTDILQAFI